MFERLKSLFPDKKPRQTRPVERFCEFLDRDQSMARDLETKFLSFMRQHPVVKSPPTDPNAADDFIIDVHTNLLTKPAWKRHHAIVEAVVSLIALHPNSASGQALLRDTLNGPSEAQRAGFETLFMVHPATLFPGLPDRTVSNFADDLGSLLYDQPQWRDSKVAQAGIAKFAGMYPHNISVQHLAQKMRDPSQWGGRIDLSHLRLTLPRDAMVVESPMHDYR